MIKHFVNFWKYIADYDDAKKRAFRVLDNIKLFKSDSKKVLELGVGIGNVLANFPNNFSLYGLDSEKKYLLECKKKLSAKLFCLSMQDFDIDECFDVIFSVHDSINFLNNFNEWKKTFSNVKKHLVNDGLFIFDMYTPKMLESSKYATPVLSDFSKGFMSDKAIVKGNTLTWDFKIFERQSKNNYYLHEYFMSEKIFSVEKVRLELKKNFVILKEEFFDDDKKVIFVCKA